MTKNKTLTDAAFEKWMNSYPEGADFSISAIMDGDGRDALLGWQAAKQETAKEITELQSQVNILREALYKLTQDAGEDDLSLIRQALSATAEQSLAEHDNATIERIATALENAEGELKYLPEYVSLVRGMKATP